MEKGGQVILWVPFQGYNKGQREEIPGSQASDSWDHLTKKQPAAAGSNKASCSVVCKQRLND